MKINDIIIIGGGLSGLNVAYEILKHYPKMKILICEQSKILGGRVHTIKSGSITLESGAGRFHVNQKLIIKLIQELNLADKITSTSSNYVFSDINIKSKESLREPSNVLLSKTSFLITKILTYSNFMSIENLQSISFTELAEKVLDKQEIQYIYDSFGYSSELTIMSSYDAINLIIYNLNPALDFFILDGGLSQIIENLVIRIMKYPNVQIINNTLIKLIHFCKGSLIFKIMDDKNKVYECKKCICAVPRPALEKMVIYNDTKILGPVLKPMLKKIKCSPLCRIYSVFREPWYKDLPKMTTNNNLRIIIPNSHSIMMSYTDGAYADYWKNLYDKDKDLLNRELARLMKQSTGISIPEPINTYLFYWDCGVGYWGIGVNSSKISKKLMQPFSIPLFICGENYSEKNQQWMEGALETSNSVVKSILSNI